MRTKRLFFICVTLVVVILLSVWLTAVVQCEVLTHKYGAQFEDAYIGHTMFVTPDYHKVLEYSEHRAVIYYVTVFDCGNIVVFEREDAQTPWAFYEWHTVWSDGGSADGFVWPYIR